MFFDERRSHFLKDRLQRRLKACQIDSFYSYYRLLTSREGRASSLCCLRISPSTRRVSFATGRSWIFCRKTCWKNCFARSRNAAIGLFASGAQVVPSGQEAYSVAILICDALAYYYLAQSASVRHAVAQAVDSAALEAGNRRFGYQLCQPARRAGRCLHRAADGAGGLHLPAALLRKSRRQIRDQEAAQRTCPVRLPQPENRIPAAPQRHHPLPQRDDLFRRSRAKAPDRKVLALLESRRLPVSSATRRVFSA